MITLVIQYDRGHRSARVQPEHCSSRSLGEALITPLLVRLICVGDSQTAVTLITRGQVHAFAGHVNASLSSGAATTVCTFVELSSPTRGTTPCRSDHPSIFHSDTGVSTTSPLEFHSKLTKGKFEIERLGVDLLLALLLELSECF